MTVERNISPIFPIGTIICSTSITAANTASDGSGTIGTNIFLLYGYPGVNVKLIKVMPTATSAATSTVETVIRLFNSSKKTGTTSSSDTFLIQEVHVPIMTADHSTNAVDGYVLMDRCYLPGYALVTSHVAPATNTSWQVTLIG